ncbi:MAG: GNAT family N-acetyltransferase [Gammaproteobacteria bacterium]|nr:MAG: GNAT family N-acetyltransferase [Gammaproteobacteria bacterium]
MARINQPGSLNNKQNFASFDCGNGTLNEWLKKRAFKYEASGASRTFVVTNEANSIIGFYCLSAGAIEHESSPNKVRRNMPDPIPVMILRRLAVDAQYQHQSIGKSLLKDAILRTINVSQQTGIRALLVHALSEEAKQFYTTNGFYESPTNDMTLMITIKDAIAGFAN